MNNIKNYNDFIEERIDLRKAAIGTAVAGGLFLGYNYYNQNKGIANLEKTIKIEDEDFKKYSLITKYQIFELTINKSVVVSTHSYTVGDDDDEKVITITNAIIPTDVKTIWYETKFLKGTFASSEYFKGSKQINIDDLKIYKRTKTYTIYSGGFLCPFNYVIVNNHHKEGDEYKLSDGSANYVCDRYNDDIYIFSLKNLGGGGFGGSGSSSEF